MVRINVGADPCVCPGSLWNEGDHIGSPLRTMRISRSVNAPKQKARA